MSKTKMIVKDDQILVDLAWIFEEIRGAAKRAGAEAEDRHAQARMAESTVFHKTGLHPIADC